MISLLLTLFISLFSIGSSINTIDDHIENNIVINQNINKKNSYDYNGSVYYLSTEDFTFNKLYFGGLSSFGQVFSLSDNREFVYDFTGTQVSEIKYNVLSDNNNLSSYNLSGITRVRIGKEINNGYYNYFIYFYTSAQEQNITSFGCDYFVYPDLYRYSEGDLRGDLCTTEYWFVNGDNTFGVYPRGLIISFYGAGGYDLWNWYTVSTEPGSYDDGFNDGRLKGFQEGETYAREQFENYDDTALTIFTGITEIGLLPVNVFLKVFEFEVFGINLSGLVGGLLTIAVVVIIIRFLLGEKDSK